MGRNKGVSAFCFLVVLNVVLGSPAVAVNTRASVVSWQQEVEHVSWPRQRRASSGRIALRVVLEIFKVLKEYFSAGGDAVAVSNVTGTYTRHCACDVCAMGAFVDEIAAAV